MGVNRYLGGVISADPNTPTVESASGTWTLAEAYQNIGNWPMAQSQIQNSLRFNDDDSAYLSRTPASAGNRKTFTWSGWVKRSQATDANGDILFSGRIDDNNRDSFGFAQGIIQVFNVSSGSVTTQFDTTAVFRDSSAWYHVLFSVDTTQATEANRFKIYVNGSQITQFSTANYPSQNEDFFFNSTGTNYIGVYGYSTLGGYFDGYLTEVNFIDGLALSADYFGFFDANGIWQPKPYKGAYGTNGFYLNFSDNSGTTSTTLGKDYSGNSNNWTPNNFSVTAGAGNDSLVDTPTPYGTDTGVGGEVRGNYCTWNPLDVGSSNMASSNGNLVFTKSSTGFSPIRGTLAVTSGKYYFEMLANNSNLTQIGVSNGYNIRQSSGDNSLTASGANGAAWDSRGYLYYPSGGGSYGYTFTTNDIVMVAFDADSGKIWFGKNGTWNTGSPSAGTSPAYTASGYDFLTPFGNGESGGSGTANFGQRPFAYTAPSGFKALCTQNLPTPTILDGADYFDALLYTGNGSAGYAITGLDFKPDFTWIKGRSNADYNYLVDIIRTYPNRLFSNLTDAASTDSNTVTSSDNNGFTIGSDSGVNRNASTYVAWNWKANGAGVTNTAGTITSTVSANTTAGFSIVTYTGTGANATVGHGLGVAPAMYIVKRRTGGVGNWAVWHTGLSNTTTSYILLDSTAAQSTSTSLWGSTAATSTTIGVGTSVTTNNSSDTYVAYCFAPVAGYSAFGSYTGNGSSDGPFVYTGFRPRFIMFKVSSSAGYNWVIVDTARNVYNPQNLDLYPNLSAAEDDYTSTYPLVILSNGFKLRANYGNMNLSSGTIIYAAFAENPFKLSRAR